MPSYWVEGSKLTVTLAFENVMHTKEPVEGREAIYPNMVEKAGQAVMGLLPSANTLGHIGRQRFSRKDGELVPEEFSLLITQPT